MTSVAENLARVRREIADACRASGRDESQVRLLPVSKTHSVGDIREAVAQGCTQFGENRVQEMVAKSTQLRGVSWVLIGHLQRNKAGLACGVMSELQSLDSLKLAEVLDRWYEVNRPDQMVKVLVEVNTSGESTKSGVHPDDVLSFTRSLEAYAHLDVSGLMTVAHPDPALADAGFALMSDLQRRLRDRDGGGWTDLSMGMSADFPSAIAHGSTCVRIGTAIFGHRP